MFAGLLDPEGARRATEVVTTILAHGLGCGLTGGLAIDAQLRMHGRSVEPRHLNDLDFVVADCASIPASLAASFLPHHVHPDAGDGKTLLQLVDPHRAIRVDLFHALGGTLSRAVSLDGEAGELKVISIEDLVARTTALVCGRLRRGQSVDAKHATAFTRLLGLGRRPQLAAAWSDHRQQLQGTLDAAAREVARLLESHPELVVVENYSSVPRPCERCRACGPFRPTSADRIVEILGYC